jgi:hypothetical protein
MVKLAECVTPKNPKEADVVFQSLWTKAVGTPDYVKADWIKLQNYIHGLEDKAAHVTGPSNRSVEGSRPS